MQTEGSAVFKERLLDGKVAFVTGGGSGINLAIAERFAAHGARVTLVGRTKEKLDAAAARINDGGGVAMGQPADVRSPEALGAALLATHQQWGEIDILVCGAAGNFPAPAAMMSPNGFKSVVDIDVLGTFNACRLAFEYLRKPGASVLNISAPQAQLPMAMQAHVCAGKAGVDMITRTLAVEWGGAGVRVNAIWPGPIEQTEGMERLTPDDATRDRLRSLLPLQRFGRKDEIADLALFLCSPAAAYITGSIMACDGGMSLMGGGALTQALMGG